MAELKDNTAVIESYLQSDGSVRAPMFHAFLRCLRDSAGAENGRRVADGARRAVSLELDYTSLLTLGRVLRSLPDDSSSTERLRLAVLGGPTTLQLVELLRIFLRGAAVAVEIYQGEYGLFRQEILTPGSGLDTFQPKIIFLATNARDVMNVSALGASGEEVSRKLDEEFANWANLWKLAHDRWGASIIQNTFEVSPWNPMGHYSLRHPASRENYVEQLNRRFAEQTPAYVALHDVRTLALQTGAAEWFDPRFYFEAKMPCGPEPLVPYAHSVASVILAMLGRSKKVLVLDLDNTLWGGVVGDVGVGGIEYGQGSAQGEAFVLFQEYAKALRDQGILLAVCSKNDEQVARSPFEQRDDMVLRLTDFSCFVANWQNKADNLREIAKRLNLGLDSFVFVDDNPAERALVRRFVPEVAVPALPEDPSGYIPAISRHRYFEIIHWSKEDAQRAEYYAGDARRMELAAASTDLDTFLASLEMCARVEGVNRTNIERVTQLINKSNQFNLTTRRRTLAEIERIAGDPAWTTLTLSLRDKLGDNGLISVIFLKDENHELLVDTWVMSCRVLQRGVEQLALHELLRICQQRGCNRLKGIYIPTERNGMVRDHFRGLGFSPAGTEENATAWVLESESPLAPAAHIQVERIE